MAHVGRLMRWKMRDDAAANSPERVAERVAAAKAAEQVNRERPVITAKNADEVIKWQERRLQELKAAFLAEARERRFERKVQVVRAIARF